MLFISSKVFDLGKMRETIHFNVVFVKITPYAIIAQSMVL